MKLYQKNGQPYSPKNKEISNEEILKRKRIIFGKNLSQVFQNAYREKGQPYNVETHEKLFNYWEDTYER